MASSRVVLLHGIQSGPSTFWRVRADLETLGFAVDAPTLPGNAGRPQLDRPSLSRLADAVAHDVAAGPALVVGHSLGALVALELAARRPDLVAALVLEDPPSRAGVDLAALRQEIRHDARDARQDPASLIARLLAENPLWARADAEHAAANWAGVDEEGAIGPLDGAEFDLAALAAAVRAPITLLAASPERSVLAGAERAALIARADPAIEVESGHGIHRDRPGVWVAAVALAAARAFPSGTGREGA